MEFPNSSHFKLVQTTMRLFQVDSVSRMTVRHIHTIYLYVYTICFLTSDAFGSWLLNVYIYIGTYAHTYTHEHRTDTLVSVSYTHLTLPTKLSV